MSNQRESAAAVAARAEADEKQKELKELAAREKAEAEAKVKAEEAVRNSAEAAKRKKQVVNAATGKAPRKTASDEYREKLGEMAAKGLLCPNQTCRSRRSKVLDTVQEAGLVVRHRECLACGQRFKTTES